MQMKQIIIESDPLVTIKAINGETNSPRLNRNIVKDIKMLIKIVRNIQFAYCNRLANMLANMLSKKVQFFVILNVVLSF